MDEENGVALASLWSGIGVPSSVSFVCFLEVVMPDVYGFGLGFGVAVDPLWSRIS